MRATEFIAEAEHKKEVIISHKMIAMLNSECKDFIWHASRPLYRGFTNSLPLLSKANIRQNRLPKDSEGADTAAFNYLIEGETGVETIRNRCAYATTDINTASEYAHGGGVYMVFPVDGTRYIHSGTVKDLYGEFLDKIFEFEDIADEYMRDHYEEWDNATRQAMSQKFKELDYWLGMSQGLVTVRQIQQKFGMEIDVWNRYVAQFKYLVKKYHMYSNFNPELMRGEAEIGMFVAPHYHVLNIADIYHDRPEVVKGRRLMIGNTILNTIPVNIHLRVLNAIRDKEEIYWVQ